MSITVHWNNDLTFPDCLFMHYWTDLPFFTLIVFICQLLVAIVFLDRVLISHYSSCFCFCFLLVVGRCSSKKLKAPLFHIGSGIKLGRIVLRVNMHLLTESNFWYDVILSRWRPWRHFVQKSAAVCWVHMHMLAAHLQFRLQFLIHSTFYLLKTFRTYEWLLSRQTLVQSRSRSVRHLRPCQANDDKRKCSILPWTECRLWPRPETSLIPLKTRRVRCGSSEAVIPTNTQK